ncbi:MAG: extracellular solute-binding protein [Opitutaceae bacterium]
MTIIVIGVVLLWPPADEEGKSRSERAASGAVRYVLKIDPGVSYMPGSRPFGVGQPLLGLAEVIDAFEDRHPDTRIEVIRTPNSRDYLVTQLSSGAAPDIVAVNVEEVWVDVQKNWYVPLDRFLEAPNPYVVEKGDPDLPGAREWWDMFRFQALSRGKAGPDGRNYCLTLSAVETGLFYNKTFFEAHDLQIPATWEEFMALMAEIKGFGKIPLLVPLAALADWGTDLLFDQVYYNILPGIDLVKDPIREDYMQGYLDGDELAFLFTKGFFTRQDPRYVEVARMLKSLRPYMPQSIANADYRREFQNQQGIMFWASSAMTYPFWADRNLGFEWGVFYLPEVTTKTTSFASGTPMCVIGGAAQQFEVTATAVKDTDETLPFPERIESSERLKRAIGFLQFLSLPENTDRVVNEYPCFIPNIVGVRSLPVLDPFEKILERRYTTTKWVFSFDLRFSDIYQRMLGLFLEDGIDLDGFLRWQEDNIRTAGANLIRRQNVDVNRLEASWEKLAPQRAGTPGLPVESEAGR